MAASDSRRYQSSRTIGNTGSEATCAAIPHAAHPPAIQTATAGNHRRIIATTSLSISFPTLVLRRPPGKRRRLGYRGTARRRPMAAAKAAGPKGRSRKATHVLRPGG